MNCWLIECVLKVWIPSLIHSAKAWTGLSESLTEHFQKDFIFDHSCNLQLRMIILGYWARFRKPSHNQERMVINVSITSLLGLPSYTLRNNLYLDMNHWSALHNLILSKREAHISEQEKIGKKTECCMYKCFFSFNVTHDFFMKYFMIKIITGIGEYIISE